MATGSKLPTGRAKRRGARSKGDSAPTPILEPPGPPEALTEAQAAAWRALWADPMARFWTLSDAPLVARLVRLRERLDEPDAPLGAFAAALALERVLYLTPQARRERLRLAVSDPPAAVSSNGGSSSSAPARRPSARERERLLRG